MCRINTPDINVRVAATSVKQVILGRKISANDVAEGVVEGENTNGREFEITSRGCCKFFIYTCKFFFISDAWSKQVMNSFVVQWRIWNIGILINNFATL